MFQVPDKGSFGYFDKKKKKSLAASILSFAAVFIIYITGILIYHTNKSIFTVIAALAVLPAARILISYIVIAFYKSIPLKQYEEISSIMGESETNQILCDILLASEKKSILAGMIVIYNGNILMYSDNKKANPREAESYMKKILESCNYTSIKMYTDYETLKEKVQQNTFDGKRDENTILWYKNMCEHITQAIFRYTI